MHQEKINQLTKQLQTLQASNNLTMVCSSCLYFEPTAVHVGWMDDGLNTVATLPCEMPLAGRTTAVKRLSPKRNACDATAATMTPTIAQATTVPVRKLRAAAVTE